MKKIIEEHFSGHRATLDSVAELGGLIEKVANVLIQCLKNNGIGDGDLDHNRYRNPRHNGNNQSDQFGDSVNIMPPNNDMNDFGDDVERPAYINAMSQER